MPLAIDERHHQWLVDRGVGGGEPVGIERGLIGPVFHQHKASRLGLGMVNVIPQAAGFCPTPAHCLREVGRDRGHVGRIFHQQQNVEAEHRVFPWAHRSRIGTGRHFSVSKRTALECQPGARLPPEPHRPPCSGGAGASGRHGELP